MSMEKITLKTVYPCCEGPARIVAVVDSPRETYTRKCPDCGKRWEVERRSVGATKASRIDILEWNPN